MYWIFGYLQFLRRIKYLYSRIDFNLVRRKYLNFFGLLFFNFDTRLKIICISDFFEISNQETIYQLNYCFKQKFFSSQLLINST